MKGLGRRLLGERRYVKVARVLKPREIAANYGDRKILLSVDEGAALMADVTGKGTPAAIGKIGASELRACREASRLVNGSSTVVSKTVLSELHVNAGVFPPMASTIVQFANCYRRIAAEIDVLAVWFNEGEREFVESHVPAARLMRVIPLEPYAASRSPWSVNLAGKRVVVVTPFSRSVESQYARRRKVWAARPEILPEFHLRTVQAPFSDGLVKSPHKDWFAALETLKCELAREPFDFALIGCSAFSLPLAVEAKRLGGIGIHLGGATQLLFGILGARWDDSEYLRQFVNENWVRPSAEERPPDFRNIEGGSYW